jgi:type I restriction enzyme M protein
LPLDGVKPSVRRKLINWQTDTYEWARDHIYGIEKDYRLAKIAKVSCFLNGDGLANIIHADGLDSFDSDEYEEAPLLHTKRLTKEIQNSMY